MLEWYVYYHDFNGREIKPYNVFCNSSLLEDCKKNARKNIHDYEAFCGQLRRDVIYWYWSKSEWEIILGPWCGKADEVKIDVYDQLKLNWDIFCKYVWDHGAELRRREKKKVMYRGGEDELN